MGTQGKAKVMVVMRMVEEEEVVAFTIMTLLKPYQHSMLLVRQTPRSVRRTKGRLPTAVGMLVWRTGMLWRLTRWRNLMRETCRKEGTCRYVCMQAWQMMQVAFDLESLEIVFDT